MVTLERVLYGPEPPIGKPYKGGRRWRCWLGLHVWCEVWESMVIEDRIDGSQHERTVVMNMDREADYVDCRWCHKMRHTVKI